METVNGGVAGKAGRGTIGGGEGAGAYGPWRWGEKIVRSLAGWVLFFSGEIAKFVGWSYADHNVTQNI